MKYRRRSIGVLDRSSTWMDGIQAYLLDDTLPDTYLEMIAMKKRAANFEIRNGELFKKSFMLPLLKCIILERGHEILEELHLGYCASHIGGRALAERARRQGYFWPTLEADAMEMVKKCD